VGDLVANRFAAIAVRDRAGWLSHQEGNGSLPARWTDDRYPLLQQNGSSRPADSLMEVVSLITTAESDPPDA
jgi:hypothetical protein